MRIDHIALFCNDLEGMRGFFEKFFGARSNTLYHNPRTGLRSYFLRFNEGDTTLELMQRPDVTAVPPSPSLGYVHIALGTGSTHEVDRLTQSLAAAGYEVQSGPRVTGDHHYESCIVGPEGILLEITE